MRLVLQRVEMAAVEAEGAVVGEIGRGLLVLAGIAPDDDDATVAAAAAKIAQLRIFADAEGRTNRSLAESGFAVLVVSQFTLLADTRRGRRPYFGGAAAPGTAEPLVERLVGKLEEAGIRTASGRFGAAMRIRCVLDGPFTIELEI